MLALLLPVTAAFMVPCSTPIVATDAVRRSRAVNLQDNPLANFLGGGKLGKDKDKGGGGALSRGFDELVKQAPFPLKVAAGLIKPLVGALEVALEESAADQDLLLLEAERALRVDPRVANVLGSDVSVGAVFSTASSSSNVNGQVRKNIQLQCQCSGTRGSGMVAIRGETNNNSGGELTIVQLQLQAGGQVLDVPTLRGGGGGGGASSGGSDGVIDVEVL